MYIDRKGWDISEIYISLNLSQEIKEELITTITRDISFSEEVTPEIKERLLLIAEKCPVSKILKNQIKIDTKI
jgi:putative redox protein